MKRALILFMAMVALTVFAGCGGQAKFTIPDEPKFRQFGVYQMPDGICMETGDAEILHENIRVLKAYSDELRRTLNDLRKDR